MKTAARARASRVTAWALAALFWYVPLWALFAALDPTRPAQPLIVPAPFVLAFGALAFATFLVVAAAALRAKQPRAVRIAFSAGGVAAIAAGAAGFDPETGVAFGFGVLGVGLAGLAISDADAATARFCLRAFLWSAACACAAALVMLALRWPAALYEYDNARAVGTFLNPNELAAYAIVALGAALPSAAYARDRLAVATALLCGAALVATFSRWGLFSALCAVAVYAYATRSRRLLAAAIALALGGAGLDAALGARHHNPVDTEMRGPAWTVGLTTFERFPLLGVGPLAYGRTYPALRSPDAPGPLHPVAFDPHSVPLSLAASGGAVGLVTLIASAYWLVRRAFRAADAAPGLARSTALGLVAGLIGLYVDALPNTIVLFFPLGYQSVALALALARHGDVRA